MPFWCCLAGAAAVKSVLLELHQFSNSSLQNSVPESDLMDLTGPNNRLMYLCSDFMTFLDALPNRLSIQTYRE